MTPAESNITTNLTNNLRDRVAVVTGGGSGIGLAIARRLTQDGARVAITGRNRSRLEEAAASIGAKAWQLDVREEQSCVQVFASIARELGPVSIFVANAGIGGSNAPGAADRWREIVATNLDGTYFSTRAAISQFAAPPARRDIVIISSILGKIGVPGYTAYCATKTGLLGLTRALALELAPQNIMVNAVCPGWVETEMALDGIRGMAKATNTTVEQAYASAMQAVPLGRMSRPDEVASLVAWLVSPACSGLTGQSLNVNQGAFME